MRRVGCSITLDLFTFLFVTQSFSPLFLLLDLFPSEKIIVSREILSGAHSASAYFISRVIAELPVQILLTCKYVYNILIISMYVLKLASEQNTTRDVCCVEWLP